MNVLVIILISAVCLVGAYVLYGRWLANKWGIDPRAKTPAYTHEDGQDYVPTDGWTSRQPLSAGCLCCSGSCSAASFLALSPTSARFTPASKMKANPWAC